jgi:predicted glycoside hydrolase/deacetylase ChbG (UPF0249 family)
VHLSEPARSLLIQRASELRIPLRSCTAGLTYNGSFYGQTGEGEPYPAGISRAELIKTIAALAPGWSELGCHPGYSDDLDSVYCAEREEELRVLCDSGVRDALTRSGVELLSFHDFSV